MKYFLITLLLLLSYSGIRAQATFPLDSSVWHYTIKDTDGTIYPVNYTIIGDSLINSHSYTLVKTDHFNGYIYRVDSTGKVFTRFLDPSSSGCLDTNEQLTYSFNLQIGDSFNIRGCNFDSTLGILSAIDSVQTNHGNRRRFIFDLVSDFWPTCHTGMQMKWIEGIGSTNDLFYNLNFPNALCLAEYNLISLDSFGTSIFLAKSEINIGSLKNNVWLDSKNTLHSISEINSLHLYDLYGRCLLNRNDIGNFEYELEGYDNLKTGYYLIEVGLSDNSSVHFIVFR